MEAIKNLDYIRQEQNKLLINALRIKTGNTKKRKMQLIYVIITVLIIQNKKNRKLPNN